MAIASRDQSMGPGMTIRRQELGASGVTPDRIYVDCGLTGSNRERPGLPKRGPRPGPVTPSSSPNSTNSPTPLRDSSSISQLPPTASQQVRPMVDPPVRRPVHRML